MIILGDALPIAFLLFPSTTELSRWIAFLSCFTANFVVFTTAVFHTFVVLSRAVEGWVVAARLFFRPALSVAVDVTFLTAEIVGIWLAVVTQIWATDSTWVFTTA